MKVSRNELARICESKDVLCEFCRTNQSSGLPELGGCDKCFITVLVNDAFNNCEEEKE